VRTPCGHVHSSLPISILQISIGTVRQQIPDCVQVLLISRVERVTKDCLMQCGLAIGDTHIICDDIFDFLPIEVLCQVTEMMLQVEVSFSVWAILKPLQRDQETRTYPVRIKYDPLIRASLVLGVDKEKSTTPLCRRLTQTW
jgi:hypothetical protein